MAVSTQSQFSFVLLLVFCGCLIFYADIFQLKQARFITILEEKKAEGYLINTEGCRIPYMESFDPSIIQYIFEEKRIICKNDTPPLIESNLTHLYLLRGSLSQYGVNNTSLLNCCYRILQRKTPMKEEDDNLVEMNESCVPFNDTSRIDDEFVKVICLYNGLIVYTDFFSFVPLKSEQKRNVEIEGMHSRMNVLMIGIDSVSRLNFHRQMPNTLESLKNMNAIEFLGYNKIEDNTFLNLVPVLTGLTEKELVKICWPNKTSKFDDCHFIWQDFSKTGYVTAFIEDATWMGIFNFYKKGFQNQPTDYYWGPFNRHSEAQIGNQRTPQNTYLCIGSRVTYTIFLQYLQKFIKTMNVINSIPYFGFFWSASLTHDYLNKPKLGDNDYAKLLNKLKDEGMLNNTAMVFMSDHGMRWGDIRLTNLGMMEERLPFLFIVLPEDYINTHRQAYGNLRKNARRLTTPFDLHETLNDLLDPYNLTSSVLNKRISTRRKKRGYSLFEPIPEKRTCDDAGIASHWCTCQKAVEVDKNNDIVVSAANFAVMYINRLLKGYADCQHLTLFEILNARLHSLEAHLLRKQNYFQDYTIAFRTIPGDAYFEATIRQHIFMKNNINNLVDSKICYFSVIGTISRTNMYKAQSYCVTDFHLKLYCYCK